MTNFRSYTTARGALWARRRWLALGPLVLTLACSVYDDSMTDGVSAPLGGSGADAGTGATGADATAGGGAAAAGKETGGAGSGAAAGSPSGGKAGNSNSKGGEAGVETTGGTKADGGSSGSAGTPAAGSGGGPVTAGGEVIDDMEDGNAQVDLMGGRNGYWYVGSDGTVGATTEPMTVFSMLMLAKTDRSTYAAHLKAVGFTGWGSVMGFNVVEQAGVKAYDASAYCGVQFWGKAAATTTVRFRLPDGDTHQEGGVCTVGGAANQACFDHFGAFAQLTKDWKAFPVKFSDLAQLGNGYHPADGKFKTKQLYAVEWALPGGAAATYEIWIDDVTFLPCK